MKKSEMISKAIMVFILALAFIGTVSIFKTAYLRATGTEAICHPSDVAAPVAASGKCVNLCTENYCKDSKILVECKDTNSDGCKEAVETTCPASCEAKKCNTVQSRFNVAVGDSVTDFASEVIIYSINSDKSVSLEIGGDMFIMSRGDEQIAKGLSVTVVRVNADTVDLDIVPV